MKKELEDKLFNRFKMFRPERSETENLMRFGFSCGDGWFQLIWDLCEKLEKIDKELIATQVKEKYGTLRFYTSGGKEEKWEEVNAAIIEAENLSAHTWEMC